MKSILPIIAACTFVFGIPQARARGDGDLWIMVVGPMCLAQNPAYANTGLGKLLLQGTEVATFIQRPFAECFRKHNWASSQLCDDIMSLREDQMKDLQPVYERHREEVQGMSVAFNYFNEFIAPKPPTFARPSCPEAAK